MDSTRWAVVLTFSSTYLAACAEQTEVNPAPASAVQMDRITAGLEDGFSVRHVHTAQSQAHERAYFVAGELVGPGASGQVGVWLHLGTPDDPGLTMSVNGYAIEFSDWPDGSAAAARATMQDRPARDLQRFVEERVGPSPSARAGDIGAREAADRLFDRVSAALSAGDSEEVGRFLEMTIDAYELARPLDPSGLFRLALLRYEAQADADALATALEALQMDPDHLLNLGMAGSAALRLGRPDEAQRYFARFLEIWDRETDRGDRPEYESHSGRLEEMRLKATGQG